MLKQLLFWFTAATMVAGTRNSSLGRRVLGRLAGQILTNKEAREAQKKGT